MVAALKNPEILDPERLKFIQEKLLKFIPKRKISSTVERRSEHEIILPKIKSPVKFKRIGTIKIYS